MGLSNLQQFGDVILVEAFLHLFLVQGKSDLLASWWDHHSGILILLIRSGSRMRENQVVHGRLFMSRVQALTACEVEMVG